MKYALVTVPIDPPGLDRLRAIPGLEVRCVENANQPLSDRWLIETNYLFCEAPPPNHATMTQLELVQINSSGYTQIVGIGLPERGVRACNSAGVYDIPIAEWCVCMMVALARNFRQMIRNQEAGVWDQAQVFQNEIRGKTVGIWGYGGIGRQTARLAKAMGLRVHALTRAGVNARNHQYVIPGTGDVEGTLPDEVFTSDQAMLFLKCLDFLVLAMPLTKNNCGLIGEAELRAMPRHGFLLNPARGPLVQEQALLRALREGWIAGAALDTHYQYPMPADHPLWYFPNVVMTPHISGSSLSPHTPERTWDIFNRNVQNMMEHRPLINELPPDQLG